MVQASHLQCGCTPSSPSTQTPQRAPPSSPLLPSRDMHQVQGSNSPLPRPTWAIDRPTSLFFLCRTIYSSIINFIRMQRQTGFKIKTINMDCDLFAPQKAKNQKYTAPLIRSLTQRKNREYRKGKDQGGKRVGGDMEGEKYGQTMDYSPDKLETDGNEPLYLNFKEANTDFLKLHTKTNPSNNKQQPHTDRRHLFKRYNHSHSHSIQARHEDPQLFFQSFHKGTQQQPLPIKQDQNLSPRPQGRLKVNPYTKDQYIYMRNRQLDELMQLKRSAKLTRMNSITKSYRVATIHLTPQNTRRTHSFRMAMPNIPNRSKNSPFANAAFLKATKKQSQIKPWEWMGPQQSKQYLM